MIADKLNEVRASIPEGVTLVAVSKFHPVEALQEAYNAGQRIFGESRENEVKEKVKAMPQDVIWHFIGHLQSNKVKYIAPFVSLIHSIDTEKLLDEVEKQAVRFRDERIARLGAEGEHIDVLLQLHVAQEETKAGFTPDEVMLLLNTNKVAERWPHIRLRGVMGMASFVEDSDQWRKEFREIVACHKALLEGPIAAQGITGFDIMSFGMSEDYKVAIEESTNMVRVGTAIFGPRQY